jgi:hypothetical protein
MIGYHGGNPGACALDDISKRSRVSALSAGSTIRKPDESDVIPVGANGVARMGDLGPRGNLL